VTKGKAEVARLAGVISRARRVIGQTARRLAGETTIPDRVVSLADLDARPIRRGKPQRPTEFGYKVTATPTTPARSKLPSLALRQRGCRCARSTPTVRMATRPPTRFSTLSTSATASSRAKGAGPRPSRPRAGVVGRPDSGGDFRGCLPNLVCEV
jgi:hypothetical protein